MWLTFGKDNIQLLMKIFYIFRIVYPSKRRQLYKLRNVSKMKQNMHSIKMNEQLLKWLAYMIVLYFFTSLTSIQQWNQQSIMLTTNLATEIWIFANIMELNRFGKFCGKICNPICVNSLCAYLYYPNHITKLDIQHVKIRHLN